MNLFELFAKLTLDTSEYEKAAGDKVAEANAIGEKIGSGIGNGIKTAGKIGAVALGTAATAVGALGTQAVKAYANFEQLEGGLETLFGDQAQIVLGNAEQAFKTAGLSANQYMETVTSFSASLIQSTGRGAQTNLAEMEAAQEEALKETKRMLQDEYDAVKSNWDARIKLVKDSGEKEALKAQRDAELKDLKRANEDELASIKAHNKELLAEAEAANNMSVTTEESLARAAKLADQAIIDMSDNANKMGSTMESIQNAYNGFAKGNFTMLDNLKLGYGGTKEEMERLLADAERLSGQKFDVSSYADIVEAIHVVQKEMGIAGATAEEASTTISGSLGALKGSWENLIAGFGREDADLDALINNLVDSAETVFQNILPIAERALLGIANFIGKMAPVIAEKLPGLLQDLLPALINAAIGLLNGLIQSLPQILQILVDQLPLIITTITDSILGMLPEILQLGIDIMFSLIDGIIEALPDLIPAIVEVVLKIVEVLTDPENIMKLIDAAVRIVIALAEGLIKAIPKLIPAIGEILLNILTALIEFIPQVLKLVAELIVSLILTLAEAGMEIRQKLLEFWANLKDNIKKRFEDAKTWGKDLIDNFIAGIKEKWEKFKQTMSDLANTVKDFLGFSEPKKGPLSNFHTYAPDMMDLFMKGVDDNEDKLKATVSHAFDFQDLINDPVASVNSNSRYGSNGTAASASAQPVVVENHIWLEGDARGLFRIIREQNKINTNATGYNALAT